ncbi:probable F-box protein At2g36090 [Salvia miltiorrhiza]|uniref:probable F-box protein At2g36090 n=1 Tax=Salvia miltiorrhiza TaxID=226208 RepID=UPI0025AB89C0|nr:probable F-box protein At2g36090 [Salvia miltiorrhiza]
MSSTLHSKNMIATTVAAEQGGFSDLHPDIIKSHILSRLDGPALGSAASCSPTLRRLSDDDGLWSTICHQTWPSTATSRLRHLISSFPGGGPRGFFSHAFPIPNFNLARGQSAPPPELISAVDVHYKNDLIFTKIQETETVSGWFRCSPFRVDLLEPKDAVPTAIKHPEGDEECREMMESMNLSWILIDPEGRRAANLSSQVPVAVQRHWLTGEVQARYASIVAVDGAQVQCAIVVTCGGAESGEMQVREVSLEMEDMDGTHLNGKDSLVFLQGALEGRKGTGRKRVEEGQTRYMEFVEMKRERRERKQRTEGALDVFCVAFGVSIFLAFCCFLFT